MMPQCNAPTVDDCGVASPFEFTHGIGSSRVSTVSASSPRLQMPLLTHFFATPVRLCCASHVPRMLTSLKFHFLRLFVQFVPLCALSHVQQIVCMRPVLLTEACLVGVAPSQISLVFYRYGAEPEMHRRRRRGAAATATPPSPSSSLRCRRRGVVVVVEVPSSSPWVVVVVVVEVSSSVVSGRRRR